MWWSFISFNSEGKNEIFEPEEPRKTEFYTLLSTLHHQIKKQNKTETSTNTYWMATKCLATVPAIETKLTAMRWPGGWVSWSVIFSPKDCEFNS